MGNRSAQEIVNKDRDTLYIGNLNTVEFDLNLPKKGIYGSEITWVSGHDRFLTTEGKITRPTYGMGDRLVELTATFSYEEAVAVKIYEVTILQEANKLKVSKIYPVKKTVEVGEEAYLSQAAVVCTADGDMISHPVIWEEDGYLCFPQTGQYIKTGVLTGTSYEVSAEIEVVQENPGEMMDNIPILRDCKEAMVRLTPGSPFYDAQERMHTFLLSVNDDQMLYNFRFAAGLDTMGAPVMEGWDSPDSQLRGHTTGHYLSALALCFRATGDEIIRKKALYMIDSMEECQRAFVKIPGIHEGFLSGYSEEQFDLLEQYTVYPIIWAPYYTLHKLFAGFLDCYQILKSEKALQIAEGLGTWTWNRLSRLPKTQLAKMWSMYIAGEFGGMNEVMAKLYEITGREEFIKCAKLFDNDKLFYPLEQGMDAISTLHANQHIPQIIGAMEIFKATGEKRYYEIAKRFWNYVTESRIYITGGTGEGEMFHERHHIGDLLNENTQESCASYNMMKLTKELYQYDPDVRYMDYYEKTMTNHILATIDEMPSGESTYFLPLGPGMKREFYYENSCCHGTGMENHFKYGESICSRDEQTFYIHNFLSSHLEWDDIQMKITRQEENVCIVVKGNMDSVKIRKPYWAESMNLTVDGQPIFVEDHASGYVEITGDFTIERSISVRFQYIWRLHKVVDQQKLAAVTYGPYVMAAVAEDTDYLKMVLTEEELAENMYSTENPLEFKYQGIRWLPLYKVGKESYHVYVKCNE